MQVADSVSIIFKPDISAPNMSNWCDGSLNTIELEYTVLGHIQERQLYWTGSKLGLAQKTPCIRAVSAGLKQVAALNIQHMEAFALWTSKLWA